MCVRVSEQGDGHGGGTICCGDADGAGVQMEGEVETMAQSLSLSGWDGRGQVSVFFHRAASFSASLTHTLHHFLVQTEGLPGISLVSPSVVEKIDK